LDECNLHKVIDEGGNEIEITFEQWFWLQELRGSKGASKYKKPWLQVARGGSGEKGSDELPSVAVYIIYYIVVILQEWVELVMSPISWQLNPICIMIVLVE
jgi:hypothetical protein